MLGFYFWLFFFKLEDNCFTVLCWILPHNNANQRKYTYIPSLLSLPSTPSSHPSRLSQSTGLSSPCYTAASHQLSILHMIVRVRQPSSLKSSCPLLPLIVFRSSFSASASLFLPCKQVHLYHFSRFHIYVLMHNNCFSLSDLYIQVFFSCYCLQHCQ